MDAFVSIKFVNSGITVKFNAKGKGIKDIQNKVQFAAHCIFPDYEPESWHIYYNKPQDVPYMRFKKSDTGYFMSGDYKLIVPPKYRNF